MGIAPITGIPLPFVSVGGSSMIANLAAMGVLLGDLRARRAPPPRSQRHAAGHTPGRRSARCVSSIKELQRRAGRRASRSRRRAPPRSRPCSTRAGAGRRSGRRRARRLLEGAARLRAHRDRRRRGRAAASARRRPACRSSPSRRLGRRRTMPYVLATDVVRVAPGGGLPGRPRSPRVVAARLGEDGAPLAGAAPGATRRGRATGSSRRSRARTAIVGAAVFVPGADLPVLALNQVRMLMRLDQALRAGARSRQRLPEIARRRRRAARPARRSRASCSISSRSAGWAVKGGIAYAGTRALGEAAQTATKPSDGAHLYSAARRRAKGRSRAGREARGRAGRSFAPCLDRPQPLLQAGPGPGLDLEVAPFGWPRIASPYSNQASASSMSRSSRPRLARHARTPGRDCGIVGPVSDGTGLLLPCTAHGFHA